MTTLAVQLEAAEAIAVDRQAADARPIDVDIERLAGQGARAANADLELPVAVAIDFVISFAGEGRVAGVAD